MTPNLVTLSSHAADVARILDAAEIPNILWGLLSVGLVEQDRAYPEIDFVIPDERVEQAKDALAAAKLIPYVMPHDPDFLDKRSRFICLCYRKNCHGQHALTFAHLCGNIIILTTLHRKSEILPWLSDIKLENPHPQDPDLMLASDHVLAYCGGPCACTVRRPVKVLNPEAYTESLIWLFARDFLAGGGLIDHRRSLLQSLENSEVVTGYLRPKFQAVWDALVNPRRRSVVTAVAELRERLRWDGFL
ncbi:hypothetical protein BDV12DRAFT_178045, partial [Aspergillus spectabilis]